MRRFVLAVFAATGVMAGTAAAADTPTGAFVELRAFGGWSSVDSVTASGLGGTLTENNTEDPSAGVAGVFGYRLDGMPLRAGAEIGHRFRTDIDLRDEGPPTVGYENNLATTTALLNLAWEIRNSSSWTPYIAGTVGWARNTSSVDRTVIGTGATTSTENSTDNLALGVGFGVDYAFAANWGLGLGYRFLDMGEVDTGTQSGGEQITAESFRSHDLLVGLQYRF